MTTLGEVSLNVLDLAWRGYGQSNADAVRGSVDLARTAERLGYQRHWFAAHHGLPVSASSQPQMMMGAVAAATSSIRVGSGPLLLSNYSPVAVAEQFGTLKAMYGDRIDLGLGRSSGGFPSAASGRVGRPSEYPQDVLDLLGLFNDAQPQGESASRFVAVPGLGDEPETWMLGSTSGFSAQLAGRLGLPFAYAHHFAAEDTERALDLYRSSFKPSRYLERPRAMVSVMLATGTSPAQVNEEMLLSDITHLRLLAGIRPSALTQEEALGYTFTGREEDILGKRRNRQAIGTAAEVETTLDDLLRATEVDELMFQMVGATDTGRQQSLATVMELARRNALHA